MTGPSHPSGQGKGPAITVADRNFIVPQKMVRALVDVADREGIPCQIKLPPSGGTDAGAIHQSRGGVLTGIVSVPCCYIHSPFSNLPPDRLRPHVAAPGRLLPGRAGGVKVHDPYQRVLGVTEGTYAN